MALFLRIFQHLLPNALAWRLVVQKTLRNWFEGLAGLPADIRAFADAAYEDLFPSTTRQLAEWERQFGLLAGTSDADRRAQIAGAWQATGGQSPRYLQDTVRAAGFDVYIHEWWDTGSLPTVVARNPRTYTNDPVLGTNRCSGFASQRTCSAFPGDQARCNRFLANETHYLVNKNLTLNAPPPVPTDPDTWPYFLYWGGATFPDHATVPEERRAEFERLLLKLCPAQQWLVTLVDYESTADSVVSGSGDSVVSIGGDDVVVG